MSEMNNEFEQLLEESLVTIHNGEIVEGTVISVKEDEIILNIGYKADGIITRNEYSNQSGIDLREVVKEGDKMKAKVLKVNDGEGQVLLTYKRLAMEQSNEHIREAFENHTVLKATVTDVLTGGLSVVVEETKVFIPASLVSDTYEKDLSKYAGQEIEFVISEFNPKKRRIIGDRKQLLVAEKKKLQEELFARIHVGDVVEGTVKNLTDFGAFIDLGGADGLLHISEMSWGRVENPRKVFNVGDKTKVLIKDIKDDKIALSLKFEDQNPWLNAADKYSVGSVVKGKFQKKEHRKQFGVFFGKGKSNSIEWNISTGLAQVYALCFKYMNTTGKPIPVLMKFIDSKGVVLKEDVLNFPETPDKWKMMSTTTGTFINAGHYKVLLSAENMDGLAFDALEVQ